MQYECVAFFILAALGAAATMLSFVGLVVGAAGGVAYGVASLAGTSQGRLGQGAAQGQQRLQGQAVPGYSHVRFGREHYYRPHRRSVPSGNPDAQADAGGAQTDAAAVRRRAAQREAGADG